ncbi:hypothetical protein [Nocardia sputorum]|uniref:DUF222 domain-containing protein n=1 Tax=Nocardia sputorum TaxID=2984338 RepID=A0ABN6U1Y6_9NOCA|nr:hypothetical protein [Nocardia sputorum]BDT99292.1 hypothetical protein IFM12276_23210 [Nocardia sputorum]
MADLLTHAEITILAQTLDTDKAALSSLERLGADNVRALRTRISDLLFDSLAPTFTRVSKLAAVVPDALILTLAERAVPAEVAGRAGGAIGMDHPIRSLAAQ